MPQTFFNVVKKPGITGATYKTGYLDYFGVYLGGGAIVYQLISVGYRSKSW